MSINHSERLCGTILVVEDDSGILSSLEDILVYEGYEVLTAKNGLEALELIERPSLEPCLILLDMFMPVMDGWEFLDRVFKSAEKVGVKKVPIVITSAAGDRAKEAAKMVQGYIKKPFDIDHLLTTIEMYCCKLAC